MGNDKFKGIKAVGKDLLNRIKQYAGGAEPIFKTREEWQQWMSRQEKQSAKAVNSQNRGVKTENLVVRSGITDLYRTCTFATYKVTNDGQRIALSYAKSYADGFGTGFASFIFAGSVGTGKTHLAAAIGNKLIRHDKKVVLITISDLLLKVRECYAQNKSESGLIDTLCRCDLLILDDVGMQRGKTNEAVLLNQIINRRSSEFKPTGITTNLNFAGLSALLGERILDRLKMDQGIWVNFGWESYRSNVTHKNFKK
ncbi:ATP-binding protein [Buttiauxella sp. S19-1]|uniref:ATP-binding protein n=1 Tax=Buttiauxella sp. S19-1 TaxID=941430 RepID=UPI001EDB27DC|nr:ATP-binding protein [Buttiauxella sp. S19-1]